MPVLAVSAIELLSDTVLDPYLPFPWDTIIVALVTLVLAAAFSRIAFRRIDQLAGALADRNAELERRNAAARALHHVSTSIAALAGLDDILQAVTDQARQLLSADVAVLLLERVDGTLGLQASSGPRDRIAADGTGDGSDAERFLAAPYATAQLAAPLQRGGRTIGLLVAGGREPRGFDVDDVETLASLASQAAIAIENDRLHRRLRELAVVEERERIAREMHDGLAQVLAYVNTKSQAVEELLQAGRVPAARVQLTELAAAARSIYVDVREAILGLRSPIPAGTGLVAAVETYAARFAEASKLAVIVSATDEARGLSLPVEVEDQVFRITQEALANARKHAAARRISVDIRIERGSPWIEIADDGRGMGHREPDGGPSDGWRHYGIEAMTERAGSIGATISWADGEGGGTIVRLVLPVVGTSVGDPPDQPSRWHARTTRARRPPLPRDSGHRRSESHDPVMRIVVADDHGLFRDGISSLLEAWGHQVVGAAADGDEAVRLATSLKPDLVLMDVRMPRVSGLEATRRIVEAAPGIPIVMLTVSEDEADLFDAIKAGARGYLLKDMEGAQFRAMVDAVGRGQAAITPATAARIIAEMSRRDADERSAAAHAPNDPDRLTERELEVLRLVTAGLRNKEIAAALGISENTTKFHLRNILEKLHAGSRAEVAVRAVRDGLVPDVPDPAP